STRGFNPRPLMLGKFVWRYRPGGVLRPINVRLRPHSWVRVQCAARHDPELAVPTQLWHWRPATPAKPTRVSRIPGRIHKSLDLFLTVRPANRIGRKCKVRVMNGAGRFLTRPAVTIQELQGSSGHIEGDSFTQAGTVDRLHGLLMKLKWI